MKRWPVIRHIRYLLLRRRLMLWWEECGHHHWLSPSEADLRHLEDVWDGKA